MTKAPGPRVQTSSARPPAKVRARRGELSAPSVARPRRSRTNALGLEGALGHALWRPGHRGHPPPPRPQVRVIWTTWLTGGWIHWQQRQGAWGH